MARGGGVSSRGRGKFKVSRGGGRHFSRDLDPRIAQRQIDGQSSDEDEDSDEEDSDEDDETSGTHNLATASLTPEMAAMNLKLGNTVAVGDEGPEMSRAERKAIKKKQAEQAAKKAAIQDGSEDESDDAPPIAANSSGKTKVATQELSRKDREAADKKAAQERYAKLHAQGKTVEAQTDLARLQEVRRRREAAAAQRAAEAEEAAKEAAAKKDKSSARR